MDSVLYVAPFFMVHPVHFRCLSIKLSLESFISNSRDTNLLLLSMINRQNNKRILVNLANSLITQKKLSLIGVSKFFNKMN